MEFKVFQKELEVQSKGWRPTFHDVSKEVIDIVKQSGANLAGAAVAIEKGFQGGGDELRKKGVNLYSLAIIDSMENGRVVFRR